MYIYISQLQNPYSIIVGRLVNCRILMTMQSWLSNLCYSIACTTKPRRKGLRGLRRDEGKGFRVYKSL